MPLIIYLQDDFSRLISPFNAFQAKMIIIRRHILLFFSLSWKTLWGRLRQHQYTMMRFTLRQIMLWCRRLCLRTPESGCLLRYDIYTFMSFIYHFNAKYEFYNIDLFSGQSERTPTSLPIRRYRQHLMINALMPPSWLILPIINFTSHAKLRYASTNANLFIGHHLVFYAMKQKYRLRSAILSLYYNLCSMHMRWMRHYWLDWWSSLRYFSLRQEVAFHLFIFA